jgi:acetolactate synthase-1/2/3 large subunit
MLGMHGTYYSNMAVTNCDLLIAAGARFDDRVTGKIATFAPNAKIIHIDIDPTSIKKNVRVDLPIVGHLNDVLQKLADKMKEQGDAIITTEVGQHQMWTAQFFDFIQPRTFLTSGGLGTMGYGLPAALGAQVAFRDRQVIDISGDGSFQMNSQELATLVQYRLPVKIVILNNNFLGMVRQWQEMFFDRR